MQDSETTATTICYENQILLLTNRWQQLGKELTDRKDLMRKIREQQVRFISSTYCLASNVLVKKKPHQVYSLLEQEVGKLIKEKDATQKLILNEMKGLIKLIKAGKIGADQLDSQVKMLMSQFEGNFEEQLLSQK